MTTAIASKSRCTTNEAMGVVGNARSCRGFTAETRSAPPAVPTFLPRDPSLFPERLLCAPEGHQGARLSARANLRCLSGRRPINSRQPRASPWAHRPLPLPPRLISPRNEARGRSQGTSLLISRHHLGATHIRTSHLTLIPRRTARARLGSAMRPLYVSFASHTSLWTLPRRLFFRCTLSCFC